jgi:uncharacterized RDD family membrane protein YckC
MRRPDNEPLLFDLPLDRPARDGDAEPVLDRQPQRAPRPQQPAKPQQASPPLPRTPRTAVPPPAPRLPLASAPLSARLAPPAPPASAAAAEPATERERDRSPEDAEGQGRTEDAAMAASPIPGGRVGIGRRAAAGAADLLAHVAVAVLALAGCRALGVIPAVADWPAFGSFLLSFSFLYTVVPLAFWGHTLGMTWAGLTAESTGGEPLSFDQTVRRWLGALLTLATAGLPLLLALTGRSLADRLSGSRTLADQT